MPTIVYINYDPVLFKLDFPFILINTLLIYYINIETIYYESDFGQIYINLEYKGENWLGKKVH